MNHSENSTSGVTDVSKSTINLTPDRLSECDINITTTDTSKPKNSTIPNPTSTPKVFCPDCKMGPFLKLGGHRRFCKKKLASTQ